MASGNMIEDFELLKVLGEGGFGKTYLARYSITKHICALKTIKKADVKAKNNFDQVMTENIILKKVNHPFVVLGICSMQTEDMFCFVTEYLAGGDLYYYTNQGPFPESYAVFYTAEILLGLRYLHSINIVHRDLKAENVLIDKYGHACITDFGNSVYKYNPKYLLYDIVGTPPFRAPEMMRRDGYGFSVDWWGLGIITYELLVGKPPFDDEDTDIVTHNILHKEVEFPSIISRVAKSFLKGLLNKSEYLRLGSGEKVSEIMEHPFFGLTDWDDFEQLKVKPPHIPCFESDEDVRYFDREYTNEEINLEPVDVHHSHYGMFEEWVAGDE